MKQRFLLRFLLPLATAFATTFAPPAVHAAPLPDADALQVQRVIIDQVQAMLSGDAERAFETTTPAVREAIGNSGQFLAIMHGAYPMVIQASAMSFHKPEKHADSALQLVEIRDEDDKSWLALFILEQQPDQTWRISGCAVMESPWLST